MASLFHKVAAFARSPQGRKAIQEAKRFANDPRRRQQAKDTVDKLRTKYKGGGSSGSGGSQPPRH